MKNTNTSRLTNVLTSLVMPVSLGLVMYLGLNILIERGTIANETVLRYLTGHPISHITLAMFCIGVAGLMIIANNVFDQFQKINRIKLDPSAMAGSDATTETALESTDLFATGAQTKAAEQAERLPERLTVILGA